MTMTNSMEHTVKMYLEPISMESSITTISEGNS